VGFPQDVEISISKITKGIDAPGALSRIRVIMSTNIRGRKRFEGDRFRRTGFTRAFTL
jgi:hypothetical protein